jgi:NO-binding membrane sensor protein with MHYT domain
MSPSALDSAIRSTIIHGSNGSAMVIARRTVAPSSGAVSSALGGFSVGLMILRTMNARERLSWIAWSWSVVLVSLVRARLNRRRLRLAVRRRLKHRERRPLVDVAAAIQA